MTEIEAADSPPVAGRADAIPEIGETEAGRSTFTRTDKPLSAYQTFKAMPLSERCMYAFAALPVLPVLLLVGPIIAAAKCAEGDNSRYYKGAFQAARLLPPDEAHSIIDPSGPRHLDARASTPRRTDRASTRSAFSLK